MELILPAVDPLGVLTSTAPLVPEAKHVKIETERISAVAVQLTRSNPAPDAWDDLLHWRDGSWRTAGWVLALDALNFCFWSKDVDPLQRWRVTWRDVEYDGYWALAAALHRAVDEGWELWDPRVLSSLTENDVATILRGSDDLTPPIPLFPTRLTNLRELGNGLMKLSSNGEAAIIQLIGSADHSAVRLVDSLTSLLPSFRDRANWNGHDVRFLKRAQILVADLHGAFGASGLGEFHDLSSLTAFADYKVPQVLRQIGLLFYDSALSDLISNRALIAPGSRMEMEIRAATIWTCELLRQELSRNGVDRCAYEIDWALWQFGQSLPPDSEPYHRTETIYY